ncbi:ABC transporter ATP-binding protein [Candidatus Cyanaurora vandensis]|uniref:ABC transporter ATP-binding protein n=1 Tax=Candidatus Cyanaurora vandensis TaxID=2714958 RepID=UPI00257A4CCB|nr:ABC transporter ATP-binding protein [Candidatus Cyanaurora vandensis]
MEPLITVRDLTFRYRNQPPVLRGVNLTVQPGALVLIAGATGSGKSTLLNCLAGIAPTHTGGELTGLIQCKDIVLNELGVRERGQYLGVVLQNVETQLFTETITEELNFGLENLNLAPAVLVQTRERALHELDLPHDRLLKDLSAGQKQRLVLACVLAMGQPLLLLDEPFAYLDPRSCEQLLALLIQRTQTGQTVVVVEHRTELVTRYATHCYHVHQGRLQPGLPPPVISEPLPSPQSQPTLTVKTTGLAYGPHPPYPDLQVSQGERVLLQGANGSGKTTLLRLLSGLVRPTQGKLEILGQDTHRISVAVLARTVGLVLQNPNHQLFAESVQEEIFQPGVDPAWARTLLERLNLPPAQHPQALSQGQKRRLALGAVLARRPRLCLLDEITVGQDPESLSLMLKLLGEFTTTGGTLMLTSHDPQVADYLQARVVQVSN